MSLSRALSEEGPGRPTAGGGPEVNPEGAGANPEERGGLAMREWEVGDVLSSAVPDLPPISGPTPQPRDGAEANVFGKGGGGTDIPSLPVRGPVSGGCLAKVRPGEESGRREIRETDDFASEMAEMGDKRDG
mmetsp:Transcript_29363/g.57656  ORF Transcript_29363/g.57656 Transcript_29363/m.57656 type:complete len:132 (-) Transcript_29363:1724-2119(-)